MSYTVDRDGNISVNGRDIPQELVRYSEICNLQAKMIQSLNVLNAALERQIAEFPADVYELQERVTMLEQQLERKGNP